MSNPVTAGEFIDEISKQPSADKFFDRDPAQLGRRDLVALVGLLRADRDRFRIKEQTGLQEGGDVLGDVLNEPYDG